MEIAPSAEVVRGEVPDDILFDRYGYGDGDGDGSGYGDGDGYGDGYGSGYGYGSGDGSGDGSGSGYGSGDGYGSGSGSGYGSGDGSGDGDGSGYGSGDGSGYGSGSGYGDGSEEYWLATIDAFASKWPDALRGRLAASRLAGAKIAFWRSDESGMPSNGGKKIKPAAPGVVHTAPGPLNLCSAGTLHATLLPPKWKGERWWIVALIGDVIGDGEKFGALRREIIGEAV